MTRRVFLFLQGPSSPIFAKIADRLDRLGHRCLRINLNAGDQIFWRRKNGFNYRGHGGPAWQAYFAGFVQDHGVTDLVLLGEERAYHQQAIEIARERQIEVSVIEMGYLRPDWLTLERGGMSSNSHFPADPGLIIEAARALPEPDWKRRYTQSFLAEAAYDLLYNLPNVFLWFLFPHYRRHALFHPLAEYAGWVTRLIGARRRSSEAAALVNAIFAGREPFFVYPLQLQTDFQLRAHSPYNDQREAIETVLSSFARCAPPTSQLIAKVHPLDNGLISWRAFINDLARGLGVGNRVQFLDGGDLNALLAKAAGTVTVNSTVGLSALQVGKPIKVLGVAVFDVKGLSDQADLDTFWRSPAPPDEKIRKAFFRLLAAAIQVRGNFYSTDGTDAGADAIAKRLHERSVNQPGAFVDPPPRQKPQKINRRRH
ncbi:MULTISPECIES: capsule biosynthesis protein [unclassified Rhizobium]|uniref:capsule biosynthesis protein n=1 Tax=unclassified Rhizobium TaxID=2613769 RepID=UPI0007132E97|nr:MULTISPECIES: capsular biosynthesis protein [unclassified Rhizobium]KQS90831.1 capsular biosynthesis protein [Rhizobium sp. Leaf391]KQS95919.1 capsular biosynthesis protein [Rhizobium sp. Leaf386]KQU10006.1 capsular biosynthesis protein [Rhizobium sp. Leaf453]